MKIYSSLSLLVMFTLACDDNTNGALSTDATTVNDAILSDARLGMDSSVRDADASPSADATSNADVQSSLDDAMVSVDGGLPDASLSAEPNYQTMSHWLCHPEKLDGPCREVLDQTEVSADGSLTVIPFERAEEPEYDCFYVYPTCSLDPAANADMLPGDSEKFVAKMQAARLTSQCRVFAPVYRQITISGLFSNPADADPVMAFNDVAAAFETYMTEHNNGRGFVLIGHSQGAAVLRELLRQQFDNSPDRRAQLIAAYLIGMSIDVPPDSQIGGTYQNIPVCTGRDENHCLVSFATYRATEPPVDVSPFGVAADPNNRAVCTNPAALGGGVTPLRAIFPRDIPGEFGTFIRGNTSAFADDERQSEITTPFFSVPGLATGECVTRDNFDYLEVTVNADPADPRADDVGGDLILPGWGLHMVDVSLLSEDIAQLITEQAAAYLAR